MTEYQKSIGKEAAVSIAETEWWKDKTYREIAGFQLFISELCCPFEVFHEAAEKSIGRPVFTSEFGLNLDGIIREFLGEGDPPTLDQIISFFPGKKLVVVAGANPEPHS